MHVMQIAKEKGCGFQSPAWIDGDSRSLPRRHGDHRNLGLSTYTHRPLSSSFLGLPYRILNISHKEELLRGLWAVSMVVSFLVDQSEN